MARLPPQTHNTSYYPLHPTPRLPPNFPSAPNTLFSVLPPRCSPHHTLTPTALPPRLSPHTPYFACSSPHTFSHTTRTPPPRKHNLPPLPPAAPLTHAAGDAALQMEKLSDAEVAQVWSLVDLPTPACPTGLPAPGSPEPVHTYRLCTPARPVASCLLCACPHSPAPHLPTSARAVASRLLCACPHLLAPHLSKPA
eukprot:357583-Chlamydomonas_euryale.AAC.2